jgi:hypothetical protein
MGRITWTTWTALGALFLGGCATGPLQENPILVRPQKVGGCENPVYVPLNGPEAYAMVFEKCLDVVDDYFEVAYANRFDGRIESYPRVAPGLGQPWKPGSPDLYQRTLASLQSIRHRAIVLITVADDGGFFIDVKVYKELEDVASPSSTSAGGLSFRAMPTVERQYEIIDVSVFEANWIPFDRCGKPMRDYNLEQVILERISKMDMTGIKPCP